jgi:hypothetical protein
MEHLEDALLNAVWGGDDPGPAQDDNTGGCGLGPFNFGKTEECKAHDDCVGNWSQIVGRPAADLVCAPLLKDAITSAAKCAVDPFCPK